MFADAFVAADGQIASGTQLGIGRSSRDLPLSLTVTVSPTAASGRTAV